MPAQHYELQCYVDFEYQSNNELCQSTKKIKLNSLKSVFSKCGTECSRYYNTIKSSRYYNNICIITSSSIYNVSGTECSRYYNICIITSSSI